MTGFSVPGQNPGPVSVEEYQKLQAEEKADILKRVHKKIFDDSQKLGKHIERALPYLTKGIHPHDITVLYTDPWEPFTHDAVRDLHLNENIIFQVCNRQSLIDRLLAFEFDPEGVPASRLREKYPQFILPPKGAKWYAPIGTTGREAVLPPQVITVLVLYHGSGSWFLSPIVDEEIDALKNPTEAFGAVEGSSLGLREPQEQATGIEA